MAGENHRLDIDEVGPASFLTVGDKFMFHGGNDAREHTVTQDLDSHFEYDGRPNKRLSKDTPVRRVGAPDPNERAERITSILQLAVKNLEQTADTTKWTVAMSDLIQRAAAYGMGEKAIQSIERLEKQGSAVFARARVYHGKSAVEDLNAAVRKRWSAEVNATVQALQNALLEDLREVVRGIILGG